MKKTKIAILSVFIVAAFITLGFLYAQHQEDEKTEQPKIENTKEKTAPGETKEEKIEKFVVYSIGEPTYSNDGEEPSEYIEYKIIKAKDVETLKEDSIIVVKESEFYKGATIYKNAVGDHKSVLVYSEELETSKIVEEFGIDEEVVGMDSTNGTIYQGYGYANIQGETMPMVVAASTSIKEVSRKSVEELLKQVVKQNEAE